MAFSTSAQTKAIAAHLFGATAHAPPRIPMRRMQMPPFPRRADAMGEGASIGIGGWWSMEPEPSKTNAVWFAERYTIADFPEHWAMSGNASNDIASYETLAQIYLLVSLSSVARNCHGTMVLPSESDNMPTVGGMTKLHTTAWPLSHFVQCASRWCLHLNFMPSVTHLPGVDNDWSDELSRCDDPAAAGWELKNRFSIPLRELLFQQEPAVLPAEPWHGMPPHPREALAEFSAMQRMPFTTVPPTERTGKRAKPRSSGFPHLQLRRGKRPRSV